MRAIIGTWLRRLADVIDPDNALLTPGFGFRFEMGKGIVWTTDIGSPPTACRVWYFPKDYVHAHDHSDGKIRTTSSSDVVCGKQHNDGTSHRGE